MVRRSFRPRQIQIPLQRVEDKAGQLVSPFFQVSFAPIAIQANGVREVLRESLPIGAFADQDVSQSAPAGGGINAAVRAAIGVRKTEEGFAAFPVLASI